MSKLSSVLFEVRSAVGSHVKSVEEFTDTSIIVRPNNKYFCSLVLSLIPPCDYVVGNFDGELGLLIML